MIHCCCFCSTVQSQMPSLFATLTVVEEFHLFVLRKQFHKKVKKACKKVYKKLKSAIHKPDKRRIHCEKTPTFCSVAVQTSFEPLIQSLSHGGELDMSYHLNSNQNNNRGFSRPLRPSQGEQIRVLVYIPTPLQPAALIVAGACIMSLCAV